MGARGPIGKVEDIAQLIYFNAVEISVRQMIDLGGGQPGEPPPPINPDKVRKQLGYKLIAYALPADDGMRKQLLDPQQSKTAWLSLRDTTQAMVMNKTEFPDERVQALCDVLRARAAEASLHGYDAPTCSGTLGGDSQTLGKAAYSALTQHDNDILESHVRKHWRKGGKLKIYIYAHTHEARQIASLHGVAVYNTGAFQRLITDRALRAEAPPKADGATLLSRPLEKLPPCYTAVVVKYLSGVPSSELRTWRMDENDTSGSFVGRCSGSCADIAPECHQKTQSKSAFVGSPMREVRRSKSANPPLTGRGSLHTECPLPAAAAYPTVILASKNPSIFATQRIQSSSLYCAELDLKTGGATGPLHPPPLFIRYLRRSAQSHARQSAHILPTIFDFGKFRAVAWAAMPGKPAT